MRHQPFNRARAAFHAALAFAFIAGPTASAQGRVVLPAGSVIIVRTTTPLASASAQTGQTFEANVEEGVGVDIRSPFTRR